MQRFLVGDIAFLATGGTVQETVIELVYASSPFALYKIEGWETPVYDTLLYKTFNEAKTIAENYGKEIRN